MDEYLKQLDPNLVYIKHEIDGDVMEIYCETNPPDDKPVHSRKERVVKDIPYGKYKVELHLLTKKFFNTAKNAKTLTYAEKHDFINDTGRRTKRLDSRIIELCSEMSTIGCERIIRKKIADVSDTSILRLLKKTTDMKKTYKWVAIDDFALRKRHNYGSIMIDLKTRKVIDLILSRDLDDVTKWLDSYSALELVSETVPEPTSELSRTHIQLQYKCPIDFI